MSVDSVESRVITIVSETLSVDREKVTLHSSLVDDLGAESIDFLDLVFRLEAAFGIKIPENDIWRGSVDPTEMESADGRRRAIAQLKAKMPEFPWARFPDDPKREDFARLITPRTIIEYLERRP